MNSTNSLAIILMSVGIFFFFTRPMISDLSLAMDQKQEFEDKLAKVKTIGEIQKNLQAKMDSISDIDKEKINILLPSDPNVTKFISDVDALASRDGISIEDVTYSIANNDAGQSVGAGGTSAYNSMAIDLSFKTDYKKLKKFISDLETSLRIVDIRSIDSSGGFKGTYDYKLKTQVYWLKNN